ncbi:hypothetical protein SAMN05216276_10428 [Streptosporangium subroseum]|uniref:Uncharacterized protein n=1 Tax=Streptosporangium subroseum TaxID=106412 RepID=A0A239MIV3_9ACTN|nr:hypothetical protein [Streptosporangium subroseum]SNT42626.1 hypothetical protein SAMN05216276_10428 [Streptosporangium subroseum]
MTSTSSIPPSRAEFVAAWRKNRAQRKASRGADGKIVDQVVESWKKLGVQGADTIAAIRQCFEDLLASYSSGNPEHLKTINGAINGAPDVTLPTALKAVLCELDPREFIRVMEKLLQAGMPWMSERGIKRVQFMAVNAPRAIKTLPSELLEGDIPWRAYLAVLGHPAQVTKEEFALILPGLPIAVLDDMIDLGLVGSEDKPWDYPKLEKDRIYLRARITPNSITADEAELIHWPEMQRRHSFLSGTELSGDDIFGLLAALWRGEKDLRLRTLLPTEKREIFDRILLGAETGRWPESITRDYGLWTLLSALWTPASIIDAKQSEFHTWRAFYNCYRWILMGWIEKSKLQIEKLMEATAAVDSKGEYLLDHLTHAEINNIGAYLAQDTNELEFSIRLLKEVVDVDPIIADNLKIIQGRKATTVNDREPWQNPYLSLGLPHGYEDWKDQYRSLLKQLKGDNERLSEINKASKRIRDAELKFINFFIIPIDDETLLPPVQRSSALLPPVEGLSRRTPQSTEEDLTTLRDAAAYEILNDFNFTIPK